MMSNQSPPVRHLGPALRWAHPVHSHPDVSYLTLYITIRSHTPSLSRPVSLLSAMTFRGGYYGGEK